jgi:hypothetical protein
VVVNVLNLWWPCLVTLPNIPQHSLPCASFSVPLFHGSVLCNVTKFPCWSWKAVMSACSLIRWPIHKHTHTRTPILVSWCHSFLSPRSPVMFSSPTSLPLYGKPVISSDGHWPSNQENWVFVAAWHSPAAELSQNTSYLSPDFLICKVTMKDIFLRMQLKIIKWYTNGTDQDE